MKYFHCLLTITFKATLHHPCRPAPAGGSSLVQPTDTASWGKHHRLHCAHLGGADNLGGWPGPQIQASREHGPWQTAPSAFCRAVRQGGLSPRGRVLSQQGQGNLAHLDPWLTGRREDIGVDIGDWAVPGIGYYPLQNPSATTELTNRANPGTTSSPFFLAIKPAKILSILLHSQDCHEDQI